VLLGWRDVDLAARAVTKTGASTSCSSPAMRVRSASAPAAALALTCVLELCQQQLAAVLALSAAPDELARDRQQQAQQRRDDGRLDGWVLGQADSGRERQPDRGNPHGQARRDPVRPPGHLSVRGEAA
jgi:hypothetical protein